MCYSQPSFPRKGRSALAIFLARLLLQERSPWAGLQLPSLLVIKALGELSSKH